MAPVKSTIITVVVAFAAITSAHPPPTAPIKTMTKDTAGAAGGSHYGARNSIDQHSPIHFTMAKTVIPGQSRVPSLSILADKPLEEDLQDGAPSPQPGEDFYCHTTQSSANLTDVNDAVAFFSALDKQACQNKPDKCLNMLSLPGGNKVDIRVWTCGPSEDSTECSNIAPLLTNLINICSKDFTTTDSDGNTTTVTRVGGVTWLSPAKNAWISLEGKHRD
ncbi:hypothetical protein UCRPA7_1086 [Phaeoacremonium minimum UCRPA7]|uniref:Uncharacterized protein n=1 Tax=Phaeoacremonium minimum (strain UCR-PA7) TaxID=1286976 RepID=R8BVL0_PHAM7|nr:hypothetical protein UCRPA7_1086 [Phaeoacremonium minimum UCRPA7]EOO03387.1 hypothetical protein UCRPA7_1086 [Phaeoacremonium minimum UCRPA7]